MDGIQQGGFDQEPPFSEADIQALCQNLDPISPHTTTGPSNIDYGMFDIDCKDDILSDIPVQSIESTDHFPQGIISNGAPQQGLETDGEAAKCTENEGREGIMASHQPAGTSAGMRIESGDPPLFSHDIDELFSLDDLSTQVMDHRLSPQAHSISALGSPFQPANQHYGTFPNGHSQFLSHDPNTPFYIQRNPAVAEHPGIATHMFPNGRRRSQTVPPETNFSFQRNLERGSAIPIGKPISSSPDPHMGVQVRQQRNSGQHPYQWQDNGRVVRPGVLIRQSSEMAGSAPMCFPMDQQQPMFRHTQSMPVTRPGSPTRMMRNGYKNGMAGSENVARRQMNAREEPNRRKVKRQKQMHNLSASTQEDVLQSPFMDVVAMNLSTIEQLIRDGFEDLMYNRSDDLDRVRAESRRFNRQLTQLSQPISHLPTSTKPTFPLPKTGMDIKEADGRTIDQCLEFYDIPFRSTMLYRWERKKLFVRFLGLGAELMREILD